jgi:hypothetical protein
MTAINEVNKKYGRLTVIKRAENKDRKAMWHCICDCGNPKNVSGQDFNELLRYQDGGCAICAKPIDAVRRRMNVDHCHETGEVRGILCIGCNTGLGHLGDNIEGLQKALTYLDDPPFAKYSLAR